MIEPILIATAGHVDHGKSTLVQTLTGIDPDRWREEKERGITIDLGYAFLKRGGKTYSFIDVPGHEKFIHNMLAGIGSIDAALLIIAADESVMPQTREHALALKYLGVSALHVVITKVDLVDEEILELLNLELDEWLAEMGWGDAKRVHFSKNRPETQASVLNLLDQLKKPASSSRTEFRMSIDRVFTKSGSGTVVTGTVDSGRLFEGDKVTLPDTGKQSRIRELQVHGRSVDQVGPRTRIAINLTDFHYKDLKRGQQLVKHPVLHSKRILVRLQQFLSEWKPSPRHPLHIHHLAAHLQGRLILQKDDLAVLAVDDPYHFWALDRGLIRDGTPLQICAGFEVLHPNLKNTRLRRLHPLFDGISEISGPESWQHWFVKNQSRILEPADIAALNGCALFDSLKPDLFYLNETSFIADHYWRTKRQEFLEGIKICHSRLPIYRRLPLRIVQSFFRERHFPPLLVNKLLDYTHQEGSILVQGESIALAVYSPNWPTRQLNALHDITKQIKGGMLEPDRPQDKADRQAWETVEGLLVWENYLVSIAPNLYFQFEFFNRTLELLHAKYSQKTFSIQELKAELNISRKYGIPFLEHLDKLGYTQRRENTRVWIAKTIQPLQCDWKRP